MFTDYLIVVTAVSTATLVWRNLKEDHHQFKKWVAELPVVGGALSCGFCASLWMTLVGVLLLNPIASWSHLSGFGGTGRFVVGLLVGWFSVGAGVLLLRSGIVVLLELGGVLKHQHSQGHK
jgi:uncharacterized membrane protein